MATSTEGTYVDWHQAKDAIADYEGAYTKLVTATEALNLLHLQRAERKVEACARVMKDRGLSASKADDLVQLDEKYGAYKETVSHAEVERLEAEHETVRARLAAELAIALVRQRGVY